MTLHRFYTEQPLSVGNEGQLEGDQARQISRVLRMAAGDIFVLFNGTGVEAWADIIEADRRHVRYRITRCEQPEREPAIGLTVGLALLRGDRFDLAVQKLTEIGVSRIVPLAAERSVVSYRDARDWAKREARLRRIAVEAAEQSERVTIPEILAPQSLVDFLRAQPALALVERDARESVASIALTDQLALAIGPEGGWSPDELDVIGEREAGRISLGNLILRAETAAIVAAGTIIQRWWSEHRKAVE